jgi:hypothetical protein
LLAVSSSACCFIRFSVAAFFFTVDPNSCVERAIDPSPVLPAEVPLLDPIADALSGYPSLPYRKLDLFWHERTSYDPLFGNNDLIQNFFTLDFERSVSYRFLPRPFSSFHSLSFSLLFAFARFA